MNDVNKSDAMSDDPTPAWTINEALDKFPEEPEIAISRLHAEGRRLLAEAAEAWCAARKAKTAADEAYGGFGPRADTINQPAESFMEQHTMHVARWNGATAAGFALVDLANWLDHFTLTVADWQELPNTHTYGLIEKEPDA